MNKKIAKKIFIATIIFVAIGFILLYDLPGQLLSGFEKEEKFKSPPRRQITTEYKWDCYYLNEKINHYSIIAEVPPGKTVRFKHDFGSGLKKENSCVLFYDEKRNIRPTKINGMPEKNFSGSSLEWIKTRPFPDIPVGAVLFILTENPKNPFDNPYQVKWIKHPGGEVKISHNIDKILYVVLRVNVPQKMLIPQLRQKGYYVIIKKTEII